MYVSPPTTLMEQFRRGDSWARVYPNGPICSSPAKEDFTRVEAAEEPHPRRRIRFRALGRVIVTTLLSFERHRDGRATFHAGFLKACRARTRQFLRAGRGGREGMGSKAGKTFNKTSRKQKAKRRSQAPPPQRTCWPGTREGWTACWCDDVRRLTPTCLSMKFQASLQRGIVSLLSDCGTRFFALLQSTLPQARCLGVGGRAWVAVKTVRFFGGFSLAGGRQPKLSAAAGHTSAAGDGPAPGNSFRSAVSAQQGAFL